ncbi:MAG: hypothetical protein H0U74_07405 [Bradymonadaceae bacterium]|nr:hypothetical protein [Lujinxingiaceae bacterium]
MKTLSKRLFVLLTGILLALPATMLMAQPTASAQSILRDSRQSGPRNHNQAHQKVTQSPSKRSTTTTTTTTTTSRQPTHVRNVRPNPARVHAPAPTMHRRSVYRGSTHVYYHSPVHRSRVHTRYHHHHEVHHHHHHVSAQPRVVIVEVERQPAFDLHCPVNTIARQSGNEQWCATSRGLRHGPFGRQHTNGQLAVEGEYAYGEKDGLWTEWHTNGEPRLEGEFAGGERVGTWVRWNQSGQEISVTEY